MASISIRQQKEELVEALVKEISAAKSFVLIDYKGLTVAQDTILRNEFRKNGVKYSVRKNTMVRLALNKLGYTEFDEALNGPTAIALGMEDEIAPAKVAVTKANDFKKITVKCGLIDNKFVSEEEVKVIASLPSKEVLVAQLLGMLQAPIASFARAIDQIAQKIS